MTRWLVLLALCACDRGTNPAPSRGSAAPVAPPAPPPAEAAVAPAVTIDASADGDGQACAELHAPGNELELRRPHMDTCDVRSMALSDLHNHRPANGKLPSGARFVEAPTDHRVWAMELRDARDVDTYLGCDKPLAIDWSKDHAWIVMVVALHASVGVGLAVDDGKTATLGLKVASPACYGEEAVPSVPFDFQVILLPKDRTMALQSCSVPSAKCH